MNQVTGAFTVRGGASINVNVSKYGDTSTQKKISFIIDTGSPIVVINSKLFSDLKLAWIRDADDIKLAGNTKAEKWFYTFLALEIPELNWSDQLEVLVCPNPTGRNLIGRDILIQCFSHFDGDNQLYTIEK